MFGKKTEILSSGARVLVVRTRTSKERAKKENARAGRAASLCMLITPIVL